MTRFDRALPHILKHEGGYVNHPKDPGGATNMGVTQRTYDAHRARMIQDHRDVRLIADAEVAQIYREQYWNAVRADDLPSGVAYCVFDAAVNSGPGRAVRWLQKVIGARVDGVVGNETIGLARAMNARDLIAAYCDKRLAFMRRLPHWDTFGNGWSRRVAEVRTQANAWADALPMPYSVVEAPGKADGPERVTSTAMDALRDPAALSGVAGLIGSVSAVASGSGPVQYALAAVLVVAAIAAVVWLMRRERA